MYSTNTIHPITTEEMPRIDVYYGKRQDDAAEDVMTLIHQSMPALKDEESILVLNTLCAHDDLITAIDRIAKPGNAAVHIYSATGAKLREKFEFLSNLISAKNVRLLVLNSFEFAAAGSRQKHALCNWLREMRDAHRIRIVIYSLEREDPKIGALSNLCYAASSVCKIAEWRYEDNYKYSYHFTNAAEASLQYAEDAIASEVAAQNKQAIAQQAAAKQAAEKHTNENATTNDAVIPTASQLHAMTMQRRHWHRVLNIIAPDDLNDSLKNKDLQPRGAYPEAVEEPEMEYAIAA